MRIRVCLLATCLLLITGCDRSEHSVNATRDLWIVTGERGGPIGPRSGVLAGTGQARSGDSETYLYVLLFTYPEKNSGDPLERGIPRGMITVNQQANTITFTNDTLNGVVINRNFSMRNNHLQLNDLHVDLRNGNVLFLQLTSDRRVAFAGQCHASGKFDPDAVQYVKHLAKSSKEIAAFLNTE